MTEKSAPQNDGKTGSGDFVGRDKNIHGDEVHGDKFVGDKVLGDKIIYQAADKLPLYVNVPSMPNYFVGRGELIESVVGQLLSGQQLALSAEGLPGVGKTTMAVALAHHQAVLEHFKDGVLWAGLGPTPDVMSQLGRWATALKLDVSELVSEQERSAAVKDAIGERSLLLVIDDAWDLDTANLLRCGGPNCSHILTTRNQTIARQFAGATHVVATPILEQEDAYQLLKEIAPEAWAANPETAKALVEAVGRLPLAIELLGGYLSQSQHRRTTRRRQQALDALTDPVQRLHLASQRLGAQVDDPEVTLQATIALSLEGLPETTVVVFYALGAFAPKPERFELDTALAVTQAEEDVLFDLVDRNLLEMAEDESITIHQVVADVARTETQPECKQSHRDFYLAQVNEDRENWQRIEHIYGQLKWAWNREVEDTLPNEGLLDFVRALRIYQNRRGLWADHLSWAKHGLMLAQSHKQHEDVVTLLNNIGLVYNALGNRQQALAYFNRALPLIQQEGGKDGEATTLNNIGLVYNALGDKQQALAYFNRALPLRKQVGDKTGEATILNNIGGVYDDLGNKEQALVYHNQALLLRKQVGDKTGEATTLNNIGSVYGSLSDNQQALAFYNQALSLFQQVGDKGSEATTLNNIGAVYDSLGDNQQALAFYNQALPMHREVGNRTMEATTLNNIGLVYASLGDNQQALAFYNQALLMHREVGNRTMEATTLNNIGLVYASLGDNQQALAFYNQSLPLYQQVDDKAGEANTRYNMAAIHKKLGDLGKVEDQMLLVVGLEEAIGHPNLESDKQKLAQIQALRKKNLNDD